MINILVTAIGGGGHGDQILKALLLASPNRYRIFGADMRSDVPQRALVDGFVTLPAANSPSYLPELLSICSSLNIDALFHGCEPELVVHSRARQEFSEKGILLPINSQNLIDLCLNKANLNSKLFDLGFRPPRGALIKEEKDMECIDFYPVVVKPSIGGGGSMNVFIAQDSRQLRGIIEFLGIHNDEDEILVQEYVGTPEGEFTISILHDMDGVFLDSIAVKRDLNSNLSVKSKIQNRTLRQDLGPTLVVSSGISQGQIGKFPEITDQARWLADALQSKGPLNIQCRVVEGSLKVFEINPRYSGTTSLRALVGFNEPDLMLRRHLLGEEVPRNRSWKMATVSRSLVESVFE